jgi:SAM-dependent methyltransferase
MCAAYKIDFEERLKHWNGFVCKKETSDLIYHLAGADKNCEKTSASDLLYYFYRFAYEDLLLEGIIKKYGKTFGTALDCGCGTGRNTILLSKYFKQIDGLDLSEKFINGNRERFKKYKNISFFVSDAVSYFKNKENKLKYDFIFFGGVMMYMSDEEVAEVLNGLPGIMNKNGVVVTRDSLSPAETRQVDSFKIYRSEQAYEKLFTHYGYREITKQNGANRNLWCSLFRRLPKNWQEVGWMQDFFKKVIIVTLPLNPGLLFTGNFKRHKLAFQLFYVLRKTF